MSPPLIMFFGPSIQIIYQLKFILTVHFKAIFGNHFPLHLIALPRERSQFQPHPGIIDFVQEAEMEASGQKLNSNS